MVRFNRLLSHC